MFINFFNDDPLSIFIILCQVHSMFINFFNDDPLSIFMKDDHTLSSSLETKQVSSPPVGKWYYIYKTQSWTRIRSALTCPNGRLVYKIHHFTQSGHCSSNLLPEYGSPTHFQIFNGSQSQTLVHWEFKDMYKSFIIPKTRSHSGSTGEPPPEKNKFRLYPYTHSHV